MNRKSSEMITDIKTQMRGGEGEILITHIFNREELHDKARLCAKIIVNPGCSIGLHEHTEEQEIFYIIKGKGIFDDNGSKVELSAGDSILTGFGANHSVKNSSDEPLEMLAVILL